MIIKGLCLSDYLTGLIWPYGLCQRKPKVLGHTATQPVLPERLLDGLTP